MPLKSILGTNKGHFIMGMSASQARLLSLTSRQHDIEYKAQRIEAQKLQMANESNNVYQEYESALNLTKIQAATVGSNGNISFVDANLNMIENAAGAKTSKTLYLKDTNNNKISVSNALISKYNLDGSGSVGSEIEFMENAGFATSISNFEVLKNSTSNYYVPVTDTLTPDSTRIVPNISPSLGYQASAHNDTTGLTAVSSVSSFSAGQTYVINTKDDLVALQNLSNSGVSTQGINFVLGGNVDMSGVSWNGIGTSTTNAFKGIFDGNGYTISNLNGSSGLFKYVTGNQTSVTSSSGVTTTSTYGIVKNVDLENVNITKTTAETGGLVCLATGATIDNCKVTGTINGVNWVGGLIGHNEHSAVSQSTANAIITASSCCDGGLIGHDTNGTISNCVSMGSITGAGGNVGGLIGHETASGSTFIYDCATTTTVGGAGSKGAFIGTIDGGCAATIIDSLYSTASGSVAVGSGATNVTSSGTGQSLSDGATRTVTTTNVTLPSEDSMKSNIMMMVDKSGATVGSDFETKLDNWINQFYVASQTTTGALDDIALKLASLNDYISTYLTSASADNSFANNLISDISNNSLANTAAQQNDYVPTSEYEYTAIASTASTLAQKHSPIDTVSSNNIANDLYNALRKAGYTNLSTSDDVAKVQNWLSTQIPATTDSNKVELANINALATSYSTDETTDTSELSKIYNTIQSNSPYTMTNSAKAYNGSNYYVSDMADEPQSYNAGWDTSDPDIKAALEFYQVIQNGYIVVNDDNSASNEWLTNMVDCGVANFTEYNSSTNSTPDSNIATNTILQEVSNDKLVKRAEAKYEADIMKIDSKDKKYDLDLATLDSERNAIKTEIDTLKTTSKDNVDRTFKLFG